MDIMASWNADNAMAWGSVALTGFSLAQSMYLRMKGEKREQKEHEQEMEALLKQHEHEIINAKRTYILNIFTDMERHFQQLNADLLSNNKESERDMYDQRNQQNQTFILAATIMLLALVCVLIQGVLPTTNDDASGPTNNIIYLVYSISNAGSLASLFICIVLYFETVRLASKFMYNRTKDLRESIVSSMKETNELMTESQQSRMRGYSADSLLQSELSARNQSTTPEGDIVIDIYDENTSGGGGGGGRGGGGGQSNRGSLSRGDSFSRGSEAECKTCLDFISSRKKEKLPKLHGWLRPTPLIRTGSLTSLNSNTSRATSGSSSVRPPRSPGGGIWASTFKKPLGDLNEMDESKLDQEWEEHEKRTREFLDRRNVLHNDIEKKYNGDNSFKEFWSKNCNTLAIIGEIFFYIGTGLCLMAMATFMWATFTITYSNFAGALVAVIPIGVSLILGFIFAYFFQMPDVKEMTSVSQQRQDRSKFSQRRSNSSIFETTCSNNIIE